MIQILNYLWRKFLRLGLDFSDAHDNLGGARSDQGKLEEAVRECREALRGLTQTL